MSLHTHDAQDMRTVAASAELALAIDDSVPIVSRLLSIAKLTRAMLGLKLAEIDLCAGQDQLLSVFQGTSRASISTLANAVSVRPSTVSKMVDRLIEKGLMQRLRDPNDARTTIVELTPLGYHQQKLVSDIWHAVERDLTKTLASGEIDNLRGELEKVDALLSAKMSRLR